jgi:hypothetical protein
MKAWYTAILGVHVAMGWAQELPAIPMEQELEALVEGTEEHQPDLVQLAEALSALRENPVSINFATAEDLERIPTLNVFQIHNLLQYRSRTGMMYTPYELAQVKGFDRAFIESIVPFLSFATKQNFPSVSARNLWKYGRHTLVLRTTFDVEQRKGFGVNPGFEGPRGDYYTRYSWRYRDMFQWGITAQQDAGEPLGRGQRMGVDFLSGHFSVRRFGNLRSLVLGDYQLEFGQGLALWSSLAFGKSAKAVGIKRFAGGVKPFSGSEENRFMRGIATTYRLAKLDVSVFYARNPVDANTITDTSFAYLTSLQTTGLHRTAAELVDKDAAILQTAGGNLNYKGNGFSLGATAVRQKLDKPLVLDEALYRRFQLQGREFVNYAVDFNRLWRNFNMYGELAVNHVGAWAGFVGAESKVEDNLMLTTAIRKFDKRYTAFYHAPFAESGQSGEGGVYLGIDWQVWRRLRVAAYADHYAFKWARFRVEVPSRGSEYLMQISHNLKRSVGYYIRYKTVRKQVHPTGNPLPVLTWQQKNGFRIHLTYNPQERLTLATRVEWSWFKDAAQSARGFLWYQDVRYTFLRLPLRVSGRLALVEAPDFNTRLYGYEHDVLYAFSIPAYYGQSARFYLLCTYTLNRMRLQLRYGRTDFFDREAISSGLSALEGATQQEWKLLLKVSF